MCQILKAKEDLDESPKRKKSFFPETQVSVLLSSNINKSKWTLLLKWSVPVHGEKGTWNPGSVQPSPGENHLSLQASVDLESH